MSRPLLERLDAFAGSASSEQGCALCAEAAAYIRQLIKDHRAEIQQLQQDAREDMRDAAAQAREDARDEFNGGW